MSTPTVVPRPSQRIHSLDGSRGFMSVIVLLWHCFLLFSPGIAVWVLAHRQSTAAAWWFASDLGQVLATAIVVFFILSGVVLTRLALRAVMNWRAYYSSRLVRLFLPSWVAILFGAALILAIPREHVPHDTWLGGVNATHVGIGDVLWQGTLLTQRPTIDNPLWSISWEVIFSILLPVFVLVAVKTSRAWLWVIAGCVIISGVGYQLAIPTLTYMPTFLIGAVMGVQLDRLRALAASINATRLHTLWWWLVLLASSILIWGSRVTAQLQLVKPFTAINHLLAATFSLGFAGFIFVAMGSASAVRFLTSRALQYAGRISFSLYLVHVPIIATLGFLFLHELWVAPLIGIPVSIAVAILFATAVEWPAHRLSKAIGWVVMRRPSARVRVLERLEGSEI
jgi:peptidoglycan/LPS O-acetylase OafA/YrhL